MAETTTDKRDNATRTAILWIAPEVLCELLQLPPGAYIESVNVPHNQPGRFELKIRGAGWRTPLGCVIPYTTGIIRMQTTEKPVPVIDWGLPGADHG